MSEPSAAYKATMHFVGGTLGGMTGVAASYPLDTVKVRFQGPSLRFKHRCWRIKTLNAHLPHG